MTGAAFSPGDRVRVKRIIPTGHYRTPYYLQGKSGVIEGLQGRYRDPEKLAYHKPGLPERALYHVRFRQADLWDGYAGPPGDTLTVDIYEHWLEPDSDKAAA